MTSLFFFTQKLHLSFTCLYCRLLIGWRWDFSIFSDTEFTQRRFLFLGQISLSITFFLLKKTLFCYFLGEVDFNGRINILYSKKVFFKADFWPLSET